MSEAPKPRPEFRNINIFNDVRTYRLPLAGWVSILHRASGALMFLLLPFIIWLFDKSISSEISFGQFSAAFSNGQASAFTVALIFSADDAAGPNHCSRVCFRSRNPAKPSA